jgi:hypothetical protein
MSHYSKTHREISEDFENRDILINPHHYFGRNYKILLNYWLYFDELSREQHGRFCDLFDEIYGPFAEIYDPFGGMDYITRYAERLCGPNIVNTLDCLDCEIIAADLILKSGKQLLFPRLFEQL